MKKILDKLKNNICTNKKMLIFFTTLTIIGIIAGSFFSIIIKSDDKTLVNSYLNTFFESIDTSKINYLDTFINSGLSNIVFVLIIWLLGFSIIGMPLTLFMYFSKSFSLGFSIASLIINYKFKGILYSVIYVIPSVLFLIAYTILMIYSLTLSLKLLSSIIKKKSIEFKYIVNKYLLVLLITSIIIVIGILIETFIMPMLIKIIY